ncbi:MAG TPA: sulfatase-like hydrolase/transferase [Flavobacteriaceae bacterium]|nr:sulfatase-like hydrolase/transferase [Flavobacteriaceae bacterium]
MQFIKKSYRFFTQDVLLPFRAGLAAGLYPMAFYISNNYDFVNSSNHLFFFITRFLIFPIAIFYVLYFLMRKNRLHFYKNKVLLVLNAAVFFFLAVLAVYAVIRWKHLLLIGFLTSIVFVLSFFIKNLIHKIIVVQFLLLLTTSVGFYQIIKTHLSYSDKWLEQPDTIQNVVFKKKPNIFVIQTDGYVNFSELKGGYYNYDNSPFEKWIEERGFIAYDGVRSNYKNTIYSNSSMFSMKHHYYNTLNERDVLMNRNAVISIFNSNGYKTHAFLEAPYFIINRPKIRFDYINYSYDELPYFTRGLSNRRDIIADFKEAWKHNSTPNFFFFEKLQPWHIPTKAFNSKGKEQERILYLERLEKTNTWLQEILTLIEQYDPDGLVILMADHGGFVGMESTDEAVHKLEDRDKIYSVFSTLFAVKWPNNQSPDFDKSFKTNVNLFRILFSYLSEDESYLNHLQEDASFLQIEENNGESTYKAIDASGNILFEKHN